MPSRSRAGRGGALRRGEGRASDGEPPAGEGGEGRRRMGGEGRWWRDRKGMVGGVGLGDGTAYWRRMEP